MNTGLCSFTIARSKLALGVLIAVSILILIMLKYAQIMSLVKITLLTVIASVSCLIAYYLEFKNIYGKCDILYHLNNLIISNERQVIMYDIVSWYPIANMAVVITLKQVTNYQKIILFRDSCPRPIFNELMRHIRWQPINNN